MNNRDFVCFQKGSNQNMFSLTVNVLAMSGLLRFAQSFPHRCIKIHRTNAPTSYYLRGSQTGGISQNWDRRCWQT